MRSQTSPCNLFEKVRDLAQGPTSGWDPELLRVAAVPRKLVVEVSDYEFEDVLQRVWKVQSLYINLGLNFYGCSYG